MPVQTRIVRVIVCCIAVATGGPSLSSPELATPAIPESFNTTYSPPRNGTTRIVRAGENLQAVLDAAQPGDIVELEAGVTFTGNFTLPNKTGIDWITVRTSAYANLPSPGTRVVPANTQHMARLRAINKLNLVKTDPGAHHFRFIGIEFESTYASKDVYYNIIRLERGAHNIIFDRCYIHGHPHGNTFDGISAVNIGPLGVVDSYIAEIHVAKGQAESHGIQVVGAIGPVKIENNFISAAGENILIGDSFAPANVSTDITVRRNHLFKPLAWKQPIPAGVNTGLKWKVKNLLELKEGNRVLIEGNIFENCWAHAQAGYGVLFTPRGGAVSDVTFRSNFLSNCQLGLQISSASKSLQNVLVENNVIQVTGSRIFNISRGGGPQGPVTNLIFRHNTAVALNGRGTLILLEGSVPAISGWAVRDNVFNNGYGVKGWGKASGLPTLRHGVRNYEWNNNLVIGGPKYDSDANYSGFRYAANNNSVGFVGATLNHMAAFRLSDTSSYKGVATDGTDLGADIDQLMAVINAAPNESR
jgi:hypothetical protein